MWAFQYEIGSGVERLASFQEVWTSHLAFTSSPQYMSPNVIYEWPKKSVWLSFLKGRQLFRRFSSLAYMSEEALQMLMFFWPMWIASKWEPEICHRNYKIVNSGENVCIWKYRMRFFSWPCWSVKNNIYIYFFFHKMYCKRKGKIWISIYVYRYVHWFIHI